MHTKDFFERNKRWSDELIRGNSDYFKKLAKGQSPSALWIGCADSRVDPALLTGSKPGDLFVHRNIANMVMPNDVNLMSVVEYAVDVLKVPSIVVCGHHGCGGVGAVVDNACPGLLDHWLAKVGDTYSKHFQEIEALPGRDAKVNRLVEHNVLRQVVDLGRTGIVRRAWARGQELAIHGWVFGLSTGRLVDLSHTISTAEGLGELERQAF